MIQKALTIAALFLLTFTSVEASENVMLVRKDGRQMRGVLDARTDGQALWLQRQRGQVAVSFATPWSDIEWGRLGTKRLGVRKLRAAALRTRKARTVSYLDLPEKTEVRERKLTSPVKATHLVMDARTANWNADVARDGVRIRLSVLDADGNRLQRKGVLRATLWGVRKPATNRAASWTRIGTWSQFVQAESFDNGVATIQLAYQGTAPDRQAGWSHDAILNVQFQPHRNGPLEASATISLRDLDYLRDQLEAGNRRRHLPFESTRQTVFAR